MTMNTPWRLFGFHDILCCSFSCFLSSFQPTSSSLPLHPPPFPPTQKESRGAHGLIEGEKEHTQAHQTSSPSPILKTKVKNKPTTSHFLTRFSFFFSFSSSTFHGQIEIEGESSSSSSYPHVDTLLLSLPLL